MTETLPEINICKSLNSLSILKFIIKSFNKNDSDIKLIFIGPRENNIKEILSKLEKKKSLTKEEHKTLENAIPHYDTKFGSLENADPSFVYEYMEENLPVEHVRIILYETLKTRIETDRIPHYLPPNQLIYKYAKTTDYKSHIALVNYLFGDNEYLENEEFYNKLYKLTLLNKDEIINKLKTLLPGKYSGSTEAKFMTADKITYESCLNNDDLFHLLMSVSVILTSRYTYTSGDKKLSYFGYQNIGHIIDNINKSKSSSKDTKDIKDIKFFLEETITIENPEFLYNTLNSYHKTIDNEYYVLAKNDMKDIISNELLEFYFPEELTSRYKKTTPSDYNEIADNIKRNTFNKAIYDDNIYSISECYCKNIIFESLSNDINNNIIKYDLANLYNNLNTTYYLPILKYISNDEVKYIKINKPFLQKHSFQELNKLILQTHSSKFKANNLDHIQYRWRFSKNIIITIDFYENGYTVAYFDDEENLPIGKQLTKYLEIVGNTIKDIKKIINGKYLQIPNVSNIFNENINKLNLSNLINGNVNIVGKLDISKLQTKDETKKNNGKLDLDLFNQRFRKHITAFHQFILDRKVSNDNVRFFYKQVNKFYSDKSVMQFMKSRLMKYKDKPTKKQIETEQEMAKDLFNLDDKRLKLLYEEQENYEMKTGESFLYGIEIKVKIDPDGNLDIKFEHIDKYHSVKLILFYIKTILSNLSYEINLSPELNIKPTDKLDKKSSIGHKKEIGKKQTDKKTDKKAKISRDDLDLDLDLELDFDLDLDMGLDLQLDLDEGISGADVSELDIKEAVKLLQMNKLPEELEKDKEKEATEEESKSFELAKAIKGKKKLKFNKYMSDMRTVYDSELFYPSKNIGDSKYSYGNKDCDNTQMKQPYIVTKKQLETFDPEAFTGYIKYRNNYYICPRIWDYKVNKPISAKKFIENKLRSPYTNGKPIATNAQPLDDDYTVIIRKPTTSSYWEDSSIHKDWPDILKKTEKDAYPSLTLPKDHPNKLCVPCCGIKPPLDFDPNKKTIQQFFKLKGDKQCSKLLEEEAEGATAGETGSQQKEEVAVCPNSMDQYILNESSDLEKCRFGLVPKNLSIMINNHHEVFLNKSQNGIMDDSSVFLRRGVEPNKKDNILETFSVLLNKTLPQLKSLITSKLSPDVFIMLNNGELIDVFAPSNILPNTLTDFDQFKAFAITYRIVFELMDIDYAILERLKYKDIEILNQKITDNTLISESIEEKISKDTKEDIANIKKLFVAYKIYKAFYNFISHILDENEYKNYTHFLDLFSKPIEWLNKDGANILIFDKTTSKMMCNPYYDIYRSKYIILIRDSKFHFTPIVHVNNVYKHITINGIFDVNKVNLTENAFNIFEKKTTNRKMLELTKNRTNAILNLIVMHSDICKYNYHQNNANLYKELEENGFMPTNQIAFTTTQIEFIKVNDYLIPVYPIGIQVKQMANKFKLLEMGDMVPLEKYIVYDDKKMANKMAQFNYKISKIFYDELKGNITSIQFVNNLIVPVKPEKMTLKRQNEIIDLMIKVGDLKSLSDNRIETLFRPSYFDFEMEMSPFIDVINVRNLIYKDFIYNYFKYDFSRILQENILRNAKQTIIKELEEYSKKSNFDNTIDDLVDAIINIMKKRISNVGKSFDKNKPLKNKSKDETDKKDKTNKKDEEEGNKHLDRITLKVCSRTLKNNKCGSEFCRFNATDKQCYLDMSPKQLEYFAYLLANDLINNKMESKSIVDGSFIPEFNIRNKIFRNPNEIMISPTDLASEITNMIENGIYSKYKNNITLSDFLNNEKEYIFTEDDYLKLENTNLEEFKKIINNIVTNVVDLSIKNIFLEDVIYTTPFNKMGKYDPYSTVGECKFPFWDKTKKKYVYQCVPKTNGMMCPTKLDLQRKPDKWGYCPEKIEDTKERLNVVEVDAVGDENDGEYKSGRCDFPFIQYDNENKSDKNKKSNDELIPEGKYSLKYECNEVKKPNSDERDYAWCPIKYNTRKTRKSGKYMAEPEYNLLQAAHSVENVKTGKWYEGKLSLNKMLSKKSEKGYCHPPIRTKKGKRLDEDDEDADLPEITMENYVPNYCSTNITPSKGGYNKKQLYKFGVNYLKIPHNQMKKPGDESTILSKGELCKIINNKYREIKTRGSEITDEMRVNAYKKDIELCDKGESKGGYSLYDLQELAINYFGITEKEAKEMKKAPLCAHISKILRKIKKMDDIDTTTGIATGLSNVYPADINQCKDTPNRGGLGSKELKKIANDNFGIDTEHKNKEEICDAIEVKLKNIKKEGKTLSKRETRVSASKISKLRYRFDDIGKISDEEEEMIEKEDEEAVQEDEANFEEDLLKISSVDDEED